MLLSLNVKTACPFYDNSHCSHFYSANCCERLCFTRRNGSVDTMIVKYADDASKMFLKNCVFPPKMFLNVLEFDIQLFV